MLSLYLLKFLVSHPRNYHQLLSIQNLSKFGIILLQVRSIELEQLRQTVIIELLIFNNTIFIIRTL